MGLAVKDLSFSYTDVPVLQGVSFTLQSGEVAAVLGANGAGKSTLFRCVLGLLNKYGGSITIDGKEIKSLSPKRLSRLIAYIPQSHYPAFQYTVLDMVLMGMAPQISALGSPGSKQRNQAMQALDMLNIGALAQRSFLRLSGGEQQLVLIARALVQQARILLMDEPTANLDFGNQHLVLSTAQKLKNEGYAVLLSTHNPQQALLYADRLIAIKDGHICADGIPHDVLSAQLIKSLYGLDVKITEGSVVPL
ncbi:MAG: ABC transporter ATP-binding protein [Eubacteriales bacterium]|nr:ABC transporter ATP-binding protein [Eubacteriales bacterium]